MSIVLDHVTKRFGPHVALDEVSLEVADGELFVLLGGSGSGKSTALRIIAGLTRPDEVNRYLLAEMREALPGAETHVLYGPTEGTILASTHLVPADGVVEGHPIGRPLGNVRLYV